ncbi:conserved hypothetical protein [[Clostridium] ultunense Esp]|uniref:Uncharacterized protein n=1 Tax=[Clostridium] ultunense Esp TaxID=1288971 RepID=M1ZCY3_9FIRM|nr:hypothetical protein [Schnuerera ultunensis]CCQ96034.1 conserved hypothetical protein [[Clostridium] ultunense Esp]SHD76928.1 conserved protein of unknown function [[Clostridium] ultunense Esp]
MLTYIQRLLIFLLAINVLGYILVVLKEKIYLKNNLIIIDNKHVTPQHLEKADMKEFVLDGSRVKSGDEVKIITNAKDKFVGILIGAIKKEKAILMVTHDNEIKQLDIDNILKFKVISKYGRFFNF